MRRFEQQYPKQNEEGGDGGGSGDGGNEKTFTQAEVDAQLAGIKSSRDRILEEKRSLNERAKLFGDRTDEQLTADLALATKTREAKARAEGDFEELKGTLVSKHQSELDARKTREGVLMEALNKALGESAILGVLADPEVKGSSAVMLPHMLANVKVVEADGAFTAKVIGANGQPRLMDGQGREMTIKELAMEFRSNESFAAAFGASGANGGGAGNEGDGGQGGSITITRTEGQDSAIYRKKKAEADKAGVALTWVD